MYLDHLLDTKELDRLVSENYISRVTSPDGRHTLYNYTPRATYDRVWQLETLCSRGLIADQGGRVVCYPFDKFFNLGETEDAQAEKLTQWTGEPEITDKLDGSMIAIWYDDGNHRWRCTTRGSFISAQAKAAESWLYRNVSFDNWPTLGPYTFIAEWCSPDNRIVLKYDKPELRLIGARARGIDLPYHSLKTWSETLGLSVVPRIPGNLAALIAQQPTATGKEGWVVRWPGGFRVKVKTSEYLSLHRLITGFSASRVRDAILAGTIGGYMTELPEEIRPDAERIVSTLEATVGARILALRDTYDKLRPLLGESRKAFAMAVQQQPADDRGYLFSLADGKPFEQKIMAGIDLRALFGEEAEATTEAAA